MIALQYWKFRRYTSSTEFQRKNSDDKTILNLKRNLLSFVLKQTNIYNYGNLSW